MKRKKAKYNRKQKYILSSLLLGETMYLKDTGIKVEIANIEKDYTRGVRIEVHPTDTPPAELLLTARSFRLNNTEYGGTRLKAVNAVGIIQDEPRYSGKIDVNLEDLSTEPYESKAARILYKKRK